MNDNICQIKVDSKQFPNIYKQTQNKHTVKYINSRESILDLSNESIDKIPELLDKPNKFSKELKNWAFTCDYQESILNIINKTTD